jgi:hypothetical protein
MPMFPTSAQRLLTPGGVTELLRSCDDMWQIRLYNKVIQADTSRPRREILQLAGQTWNGSVELPQHLLMQHMHDYRTWPVRYDLVALDAPGRTGNSVSIALHKPNRTVH